MSGLFFPQRTALKIDQRDDSPAMIDKITFAGTGSESGQKARRALLKLAGLKISVMSVMRITRQIGDELLARRERDAGLPQRRELPSATEQPVAIACVQVDGGRIRTRAPEQGRGVHDHAWKETKVAALWRMEGPTFEHDPHPEPPRCFLDSTHVPQMTREIKRQRAEQHARDAESVEKTGSTGSTPPTDSTDSTRAASAREPEPATERQWPPRRLFRSCVATLKDVYGFRTARRGGGPASRVLRRPAASLPRRW